MSPTAKAQAQIHVCVLLWGFTAILGKLITLPALPLVWWRMLIVTANLLLVPRVWRGVCAMPATLMAAYAGTGAIVALHWLAFYGAIKLANASVAASCMGLAPAFLALVEPILVGRPFDARELLLGVAVVPGVALVVGGVRDSMQVGVAVGALSAMLVAVSGALNKRLIEHGDPLAVTCLELGSGALLLTAIAPFGARGRPAFPLPSAHDAALLAALAFGCTLLPFALSLVALRRLSAFAVQLAVNLEPVYAILIATVFLGERRELDGIFYVGVGIILAAVFVQPVIGRRQTDRTQKATEVPIASP